jgi:hypothetical protein
MKKYKASFVKSSLKKGRWDEKINLLFLSNFGP